MQNLNQLYGRVGVVGCVRFYLGQPLERRAKADVERRLAFAGGEFGKERAANRIDAFGGAKARELLCHVL